jgi:hypothetical protein
MTGMMRLEYDQNNTHQERGDKADYRHSAVVSKKVPDIFNAGTLFSNDGTP